MSYSSQITELYNMMGQGNMMEAFEKYYHDDVVMVEADGQKREGKDANREYELKFIDSVQEIHASGVESITANEEEGVTMVESWMDLTFKDGNRMRMEEVAVQRWEGDQILHERFYYNLPG